MKITAAAAAASMLVLVAPVTAMATGAGCYGGPPGEPRGEECTTVVGSGLEITSISGQYKDADQTYTLYIDFYGPNGHITNTGNITVSAGHSTSVYTWHNPHPTALMTPGYYCTEAIIANTGAAIWSDCIEVHS
ncbi:hypothetical protein [Actinocrinis sp.]|uniref:hypothetical protein n=1 Tax=Actinocrinis sp. TaxID=1920516 RepID=UPI002D60EF73|nr:hypothetical protein [Actinocrinis sp.]HZP52117.1 hypothetical protein [Actinocrinis sp.]